LIWVDSRYRIGTAANLNNKSGGNKSAFALFGGVRTGPISWLAQAEYIDDKSVQEGTTVIGQKQLASLVEANWLIARATT